MDRGDFIFRLLIVLVIELLLANGFYMHEQGTKIHMPTLYLFSIAIRVYFSGPIVKRFHDINRPGEHYWLTLIPIYGIYLTFLLCFKTGPKGENRFGPEPVYAPMPHG